jgi:transposase-like protein
MPFWYVRFMENVTGIPRTLQEAIIHFSDEQVCIDAVAAMRWPKGVECPACMTKEPYYLKTQKRWKCRDCRRQFSVKLGTIFEDSAISLTKWLPAMWLATNCRNGVSSHELARALKVTQKSAWFMLHRIRLGLQTKATGKLGGGPHSKVEVDETFIGGKARNMHADRRRRMHNAGKSFAKTAVLGILERGGKVRTHVLGRIDGKQMQAVVRDSVEPGTWLMTDEFKGYKGLEAEYPHLVINHLESYVRGNVHTNGIENFWSLLKRGLNGTYVSVEPFHLFRYVDEQAFRFNNRKNADGKKISDYERFQTALSQIAGKRLTFAEVTGKVGETAF